MATKTEEHRGDMSFLQHLEVLRWHLVRSVIVVLVAAVGVFLAKDLVFDGIIFRPRQVDFFTYRFFCSFTQRLGIPEIFCLEEMPFKILNTRMAGQFSMHILVAMIGGVILAFPYILWEFWRFVKPGLRPGERRMSRWVLFFGGVLFLLGILFGYYLIVPLSVQFLGTYSISAQVNNLIDLNSYISMVSKVVLSTGLIFELPVITYFLARAGIITPQGMRQYRRHALVVILLLSAIITPPDIASQILVSLPIILLYELSILITARVHRRLEASMPVSSGSQIPKK